MVDQLAGAHVETVATAIANGFGAYDALEAFTRTRLGLWLNQITDRQSGLAVSAGRLIKWAETNGELPRLLCMLGQAFPAFAPLQALITGYGLKAADYPPVAAPEFAGLMAVAADPARRGAILPYRIDIAKLCDLAVRLGGWKYLHDKVDGLRNLVGIPLETVRARPLNPDDANMIFAYAETMARLSRDITAKADALKLAEDDAPWISEQLQPAAANLASASNNWPAKAEIDAVVGDLSIVTSSGLAALNLMIKTTAAGISDLSLHEKLGQLQTNVTASAPNAEQLTDEIGSVDHGVATLLSRVDGHGQWQNAKDRLAGLILSRDSPVSAARSSWDAIDKRLGRINPLPDDLPAARAAVVAAFTADDQRALQGGINRLRSIVDKRFYEIDKDLLNDADAVEAIGKRLTEVLESLDG